MAFLGEKSQVVADAAAGVERGVFVRREPTAGGRGLTFGDSSTILSHADFGGVLVSTK